MSTTLHPSPNLHKQPVVSRKASSFPSRSSHFKLLARQSHFYFFAEPCHNRRETRQYCFLKEQTNTLHIKRASQRQKVKSTLKLVVSALHHHVRCALLICARLLFPCAQLYGERFPINQKAPCTKYRCNCSKLLVNQVFGIPLCIKCQRATNLSAELFERQ